MAKKSAADQAGILVWGRLLADLAGMLTPIVIVRLLSQPEVGVWASVMVVYQTTTMLLTGGLPRAVLYALTGRADRERKATTGRLIGLMLFLGGVAAVGLAAVGWSAGFGTDTSSAFAYLPYIALYAVFDLPLRLVPTVMLAEGRAHISAVINVTRSLGTTLAVLVPAALGFGVPGVLMGTVVVGSLHGIAFFIIIRGLYPRGPGQGGMSLFELIRFGVPLGLTEIAAALNQRLDMWLVIAFLPVAAAAEYKIGAWQLPLVTTVAYSTGNSFLPRYTELYATGRAPEAIALWHGTIRKLSLLAIPMGTAFMVGADAFVVGVFGEAYARSGSVLRAYAFLTAGRVAAFGPMLVAAGRPGLLAWAAAFTLVSNLVISLPLVVTLGFVGPALGTAIAFVPMVGFYCVAIARASGCPVWGIFPLASIARVVAATLPGVVGALALEAYGELHPLLAFAGISGIVFGSFAIVATATGIITRDDWVYVRRWLGLRVF